MIVAPAGRSSPCGEGRRVRSACGRVAAGRRHGSVAEDTLLVGRHLSHPERVEQFDERRPAGPADPFTAIVRALARQDPRFVRRVSAPAPGGPGAGDLMIVVGLVATVLLGVLPLALGIQGGLAGLVLLGATGCLVLPVGAPLAVRALLRRLRPLMV